SSVRLSGFLSLLIFSTVFFFSSRRRHTRSKRDWSSDVCSSDLTDARPSGHRACRSGAPPATWGGALGRIPGARESWLPRGAGGRSEERRVGKECRWRRGAYHEKKKMRRRKGRG